VCGHTGAAQTSETQFDIKTQRQTQQRNAVQAVIEKHRARIAVLNTEAESLRARLQLASTHLGGALSPVA
jgi:hypothetical protein